MTGSRSLNNARTRSAAFASLIFRHRSAVLLQGLVMNRVEAGNFEVANLVVSQWLASLRLFGECWQGLGCRHLDIDSFIVDARFQDLARFRDLLSTYQGPFEEERCVELLVVQTEIIAWAFEFANAVEPVLAPHVDDRAQAMIQSWIWSGAGSPFDGEEKAA